MRSGPSGPAPRWPSSLHPIVPARALMSLDRDRHRDCTYRPDRSRLRGASRCPASSRAGALVARTPASFARRTHRSKSPARGFTSAPERTRTSTDHTVHKALNLARLPIPPQARGAASISADGGSLETLRGALSRSAASGKCGCVSRSVAVRVGIALGPPWGGHPTWSAVRRGAWRMNGTQSQLHSKRLENLIRRAVAEIGARAAVH